MTETGRKKDAREIVRQFKKLEELVYYRVILGGLHPVGLGIFDKSFHLRRRWAIIHFVVQIGRAHV